MVLVYGAEHQLDLIRAEAANRDFTVHIVIDIIHVLELHLESGVVPASCRRSRSGGLGSSQGARGAWPTCCTSSLKMLTRRTPSVTGGSQRVSTIRSRSVSESGSIQRMSRSCTAAW